jgi:DNA-binding cell septation regulator SpoVG
LFVLKLAFVLLFMTITAVKTYPYDSGEPNSSMRASADVIFNDMILKKDFCVLISKTGRLFVDFPSQKGKDGQFRDTVEFKSEKLKSEVRSAILDIYKTYF